MKKYSAIAIGVFGGLAALAGIGWAGLQVKPPNLQRPAMDSVDVGIVELPEDVPKPVHRYYQAVMSNEAPRIESLIVYGRARANFGLWMPLRYRLVHAPGHSFERYMEVTWFGIPVLRAIDRYADGKGMTGPLGNEATGPEIDQGANMILWAEAPLMPTLWITDDRIRWEPIDDASARLFFPFEDSEDELIVHFDADNGLITRMTALRYRDAESGKIPWHVDFLAWQTLDGVKVPKQIAITWADHAAPWSYWDVDYLLYNVNNSNSLSIDETRLMVRER